MNALTLMNNNFNYVYYFPLTNELFTYRKPPKGKTYEVFITIKRKKLLLGKLVYIGEL